MNKLMIFMMRKREAPCEGCTRNGTGNRDQGIK